ncbi:MAG: universal stress protein [Gemmatimonadaceae bacterium]
MYQSILVPLDGSAFSAAALPVAAAFARRTSAELHLVTVYDPSAFVHFRAAGAGMHAFTPSTVDEQCRIMLAAVQEQAASIANTGLKASGTLLEGTIVEALAEHAELTNADLVIMTTHGRSGLDRLRLGSVATSFLSRSPIPVFLVRPTGADAPQAGHELPTGALLVPLDGSAFAESILQYAAPFANAVGLSLELVAVGTRDAAQSNREYLERVATTIEVSVAPKVTVLSEPSAARALVDYAAASHPGAFALATHGRSGIVRLVLGSVTEKILTGAQQPLLVYRPLSDAPSA